MSLWLRTIIYGLQLCLVALLVIMYGQKSPCQEVWFPYRMAYFIRTRSFITVSLLDKTRIATTGSAAIGFFLPACLNQGLVLTRSGDRLKAFGQEPPTMFFY
ncbi:Uncharacterized protein TCM_004898 [Theobroma cacao]|uniref:Uncharacterized protein n=1 Tax=Theobroma cacao TaxID=3641 RepID=A0A061DRN9_THECC|nr:Uncharacterized protein TCM_004898 [Theobroma cacao]